MTACRRLRDLTLPSGHRFPVARSGKPCHAHGDTVWRSLGAAAGGNGCRSCRVLTEALGLLGRLEPLHLAFSPSRRPVRVLCSVIQIPAGAVPRLQQDLATSHTIAAQGAREEAARLVFGAGLQTPEENVSLRSHSGGPAPGCRARRRAVRRAPETEQLTVDPQVNLIHVPGVGWPRSRFAQLGRELSAKAQAPATDALVADHYPPLGQDQLDVAQAQTEQVVQPSRVVDDLGREGVASVRWWARTAPRQLGRTTSFPPGRVNVTMPAAQATEEANASTSRRDQ